MLISFIKIEKTKKTSVAALKLFCVDVLRMNSEKVKNHNGRKKLTKSVLRNDAKISRVKFFHSLFRWRKLHENEQKKFDSEQLEYRHV